MTQKMKFNYNWDSREIREAVNQGYQLTCPRCNSDLEVALTPEVAKEKHLRTGICCPKNENHVGILLKFNLRQFWDDFKEDMKNSRAEIKRH